MSTTLSADVSTDRVARASASANLQYSDSAPSSAAHDIDGFIEIISFSSRNQMTSSTLLTTRIIQKLFRTCSSLSLSLSLSRTATDRLGTRQRFRARMTIEAVSWIANFPSADLDTSSVNRAVTLPSSQELAIADLM